MLRITVFAIALFLMPSLVEGQLSRILKLGARLLPKAAPAAVREYNDYRHKEEEKDEVYLDRLNEIYGDKYKWRSANTADNLNGKVKFINAPNDEALFISRRNLNKTLLEYSGYPSSFVNSLSNTEAEAYLNQVKQERIDLGNEVYSLLSLFHELPTEQLGSSWDIRYTHAVSNFYRGDSPHLRIAQFNALMRAELPVLRERISELDRQLAIFSYAGTTKEKIASYQKEAGLALSSRFDSLTLAQLVADAEIIFTTYQDLRNAQKQMGNVLPDLPEGAISDQLGIVFEYVNAITTTSINNNGVLLSTLKSHTMKTSDRFNALIDSLSVLGYDKSPIEAVTTFQKAEMDNVPSGEVGVLSARTRDRIHERWVELIDMIRKMSFGDRGKDKPLEALIASYSSAIGEPPNEQFTPKVIAQLELDVAVGGYYVFVAGEYRRLFRREVVINNITKEVVEVGKAPAVSVEIRDDLPADILNLDTELNREFSGESLVLMGILADKKDPLSDLLKNQWPRKRSRHFRKIAKKRDKFQKSLSKLLDQPLLILQNSSATHPIDISQSNLIYTLRYDKLLTVEKLLKNGQKGHTIQDLLNTLADQQEIFYSPEKGFRGVDWTLSK